MSIEPCDVSCTEKNGVRPQESTLNPKCVKPNQEDVFWLPPACVVYDSNKEQALKWGGFLLCVGVLSQYICAVY